MITGFMVSQNVDNQESLLLSHPVDREVRAGGLDMSPVVFTFDPALTRINFRIKKESSLTDALHLNVLRMYNLKSSGNCTHNGNRIIWDTSSAQQIPLDTVQDLQTHRKFHTKELLPGKMVL